MMQQQKVVYKEGNTNNARESLRNAIRSRILNRDTVIKKIKDKVSLFEEKKSADEGLREIIKEEVKDVLKDEQTFENLIEESHQIVLKVTTVFPFTFFPDQVIIDTHKVSIYHKTFFFSEQVNSVLIKDIANVTVETNIFFATLQIVDRLFTQNPYRVRYLKKREAMLARRIIQGLMVSIHQGVEFSKMDVKDFRRKLEVIGKSHGR